MRILIAYATKSGTTAKAAQLLANELQKHTVTLANLAETAPVPGDFDYIVMGGPIRAGKVHPALRRYVKANEAAIAAVPHTLFVCCAYGEMLGDYLQMSYPASIRDTAEEMLNFGGELDVSKQKGWDKLITRMMRNSILEDEDGDQLLPCLLPEHIRLLADRLRVRT